MPVAFRSVLRRLRRSSSPVPAPAFGFALRFPGEETKPLRKKEQEKNKMKTESNQEITLKDQTAQRKFFEMQSDKLRNWNELLVEAVQTPGRILEAYTYFHNYSIGNALMALEQCVSRGIQPGPINTFMGWKELGRHIRKGEKAINLWMPITSKKKETNKNGDEEEIAQIRFILKSHWFVLAQTEGKEFAPVTIPNFEMEQALTTLQITRIPFDGMDGNKQGYALERKIAINPLASLPHKSFFHEVGHVVLGHTTESRFVDSDERTPRDIREVEAESVALLCCASLGLDGQEYSRGYIQHWLKGNSIPEKSAQKIFAAAATILKAGQEASHLYTSKCRSMQNDHD